MVRTLYITLLGSEIGRALCLVARSGTASTARRLKLAEWAAGERTGDGGMGSAPGDDHGTPE